nr:hypothetical protein [Tanacetum cinerariifolium]
MEVAEMRMLRWTCGKTILDMILNGAFRRNLQVATIVNKMREGRLRWFGHVKRGTPKLWWEDRPKTDLKELLLLLLLSEDMAYDRTSILARKWRYTWTKIPKLVFNAKDLFKKPTAENEVSVLERTFDEPSERKHLKKMCNVFYAIFQVLLQHEGPIHEFTLSMNANETLPSSVFSMHQLTELHLQDCLLDRRSISNVSGSLTSLYLADVFITMEILLRLISKSPLLKSFTIVITQDIYIYDDGSAITDLFKCLPVIEHLTLSLLVIQALAQGEVQRKLPVSLVHLKYTGYVFHQQT